LVQLSIQGVLATRQRNAVQFRCQGTQPGQLNLGIGPAAEFRFGVPGLSLAVVPNPENMRAARGHTGLLLAAGFGLASLAVLAAGAGNRLAVFSLTQLAAIGTFAFGSEAGAAEATAAVGVTLAVAAAQGRTLVARLTWAIRAARAAVIQAATVTAEFGQRGGGDAGCGLLHQVLCPAVTQATAKEQIQAVSNKAEKRLHRLFLHSHTIHRTITTSSAATSL
jgi:hypothetical protein